MRLIAINFCTALVKILNGSKIDFVFCLENVISYLFLLFGMKWDALDRFCEIHPSAK